MFPAPSAAGNLSLQNRVIMSPMAMSRRGRPSPTISILVHPGSARWAVPACSYTENGLARRFITLGCAGMYKPAAVDAWKRIVDFVHANLAAKMNIQLVRGRKGAPGGPGKGIDQPLESGGWELISFAAPYLPHSQVPREMKP